jgi:ComF family protein
LQSTNNINKNNHIISISYKARQAFCFVLDSFNQLIWPAVCIVCREKILETSGGLCRKCWEELLACSGSQYCQRCGRDSSNASIVEGVCPDCQGMEIQFDSIARCGVYDKILRQMIVSFKNGRTELDTILGFMADSTLQVGGFYQDIEIFVPVPLHWSRRVARGYNQSEVIIRRLKKKKIQVSTDLVRIRRTRPQPSMVSPAARSRNVAGAFAVRPGHKFAGRNICLVDDIKTTGATLNECATVLKQAGATKVFALVLAVAGQRLS